VLDPLLEGHGPSARRRDEVLLAVEVVRWLAFGLTLNALMPTRLPPDPPAPEQMPLHPTQRLSSTEIPR